MDNWIAFGCAAFIMGSIWTYAWWKGRREERRSGERTLYDANQDEVSKVESQQWKIKP